MRHVTDAEPLKSHASSANFLSFFHRHASPLSDRRATSKSLSQLLVSSHQHSKHARRRTRRSVCQQAIPGLFLHVVG